MPYISQVARNRLLEPKRTPTTVGELNYVLTGEILRWLSSQPSTYASYNEVMGVLACISHELYRRLVVPYEEERMKLNGDVFDNVGENR